MNERECKLLLTDAERGQVAQALESMLSDLSYEISNTDNHDYREGLKAKRDAVRKVSEQLNSG
jgi:hypothetical protein